VVDKYFKAISSLKEIVVSIHDKLLSYDLREKMRSYRWTIEVTEREVSKSVGSYDEDDDYWWNDYCNEDAREDERWWGGLRSIIRGTILIKIKYIRA
jgi:hypothetical protein